MPDPDLIAQIANIPLYADLDESERADLAHGLNRMHFADGEALMLQGAQPDGAYFIVSGRVQVLTKLPGGGEMLIAEPGPGSTLGELALIRYGRRAATVRAVGAVEAIYADRRYFGAAMAQLRPGALKVLRCLAQLLSERLRVLHGTIRVAVADDRRAYEPVALPPPPGPPQRGAPAGFAYADFLPLLPCFRGFGASEIETVRTRAEVLSARRGTRLYDAGSPPERCYIVVRGAVTSGFVDGEAMHQLNVLGPGRFCAVGSLVEDRPTSAGYVVREDAVLLELARKPFRELYLGADQAALLLLRAVNEHQANMVSRANNHLTRLVGLSRLSRQLHSGAGVSV
jgi:CRP-like cAMP-binding protein